MPWTGKRVLVTGAGGFIGSHLCEELVQLGADVRAFTHYNSRNDWGNLEYVDKRVRESLEILSGDIQDPDSVRQGVKGCDVVFHLAALIGIPYSYVAPMSYVNINIHGTVNVMQACREEGVSRIVHTSTSETYGTALYAPIDEKHPLQGQSPYAASKIGADKMAESYYLSFGSPVVIIRPFNTFGPRQSARAVIPTILSQILSDQKKIRLGSLEPIRDLNYVKDIVDGFLKGAESTRAIGEVINIGSGSGISIGELVECLMEYTGKKVEVISEPDRIRPERSEVMKLICDNKKADELVGWSPMWTLERGLRETIAYIEQHLGRYKSTMYNI